MRVSWKIIKFNNITLEWSFFLFLNCSRYDDELENTWGCASWCEYILTVIIASVLLIGSTVLALFWVIEYRGGFAWRDDPKRQFNLHPVLNIAGFITFSGFCKSTIFKSISLLGKWNIIVQFSIWRLVLEKITGKKLFLNSIFLLLKQIVICLF